jgi:uncharacterized membrane protein
VKTGLISLQAAQPSDHKKGVINDAKILRESYFAINRQDSAYYYGIMEVNYRDTAFDEQSINQVCDMTLAEQIRQNEEAENLKEQKQKSKRNIQYSAIALVIVSFLILFLLFSRSIRIIGLLITFEFINLLVHPYLAHFTHDSPFLILLCMVMIAALLVPIHHYLDGKVTHQLVEKNKRLKIAAARMLLEKYDHETELKQGEPELTTGNKPM